MGARRHSSGMRLPIRPAGDGDVAPGTGWKAAGLHAADVSWNGSTWHALAGSAPDRALALALDATSGRPLLLVPGAEDFSTATWGWTGATWESVTSGPPMAAALTGAASAVGVIAGVRAPQAWVVMRSLPVCLVESSALSVVDPSGVGPP